MFDSELTCRWDGARTVRLVSPLIWTGTQGDTFIVPAGFRTDFATVPRVLRSVVESYGAYTRAAVLHDWLLRLLAYWQRMMRLQAGGHIATPADVPEDVRSALFTEDGRLLPQPPVTSRDIDGIFRKVMQELGVGYAKRWSMWAAVRWGALFNADRAYGRGFAADLPRVLPISVLAVPFLAPAAVGNLISLTFARLVTWSTPPVRLPRRGGGAAPKGKLP